MPIVDQNLWDSVQALIAKNGIEKAVGTQKCNPSLLTGLNFDADGNRMTPSHAVKDGKRYRYYVSNTLVTDIRDAAPDSIRIPAAEVEQLVMDATCKLLADPARVYDAIQSDIT